MYESSAPGSIMLLGEHAVLHGQAAVVLAVDKHIKIILTPREDRKIMIHSSLGNYETELNNINIEKPFQFILAAINKLQEKLNVGFELVVESEVSDKVGLGSSAAVTVATLAVIHQWLEMELSSATLFRLAKEIVLTVQGCGSGADVAASVFGGCVFYQAEPLIIEKLARSPDVSLIYSGYKTATADVIALVNAKINENPEYYHKVFKEIGECSQKAKRAINKSDWNKLGSVFSKQHQLMRELGVSDDNLDAIVNCCDKQTHVTGAKISGSGLGDCVVVLGDLDKSCLEQGWSIININN